MKSLSIKDGIVDVFFSKPEELFAIRMKNAGVVSFRWIIWFVSEGFPPW